MKGLHMEEHHRAVIKHKNMLRSDPGTEANIEVETEQRTQDNSFFSAEAYEFKRYHKAVARYHEAASKFGAPLSDKLRHRWNFWSGSSGFTPSEWITVLLHYVHYLVLLAVYLTLPTLTLLLVSKSSNAFGHSPDTFASIYRWKSFAWMVFGSANIGLSNIDWLDIIWTKGQQKWLLSLSGWEIRGNLTWPVMILGAWTVFCLIVLSYFSARSPGQTKSFLVDYSRETEVVAVSFQDVAFIFDAREMAHMYAMPPPWQFIAHASALPPFRPIYFCSLTMIYGISTSSSVWSAAIASKITSLWCSGTGCLLMNSTSLLMLHLIKIFLRVAFIVLEAYRQLRPF